MMSVFEYADDMNKNVDEILKMCEKLNINVSTKEDMLDDEAIVLLDNAFSNEEQKGDFVKEIEQDEEIIKKM